MTERASGLAPADNEPAPANRVDCYSGYTYAQEPRVVFWQGQRYAVVEVERRWRTPDGPAFWVRTETGAPGGRAAQRFQVHYHEPEDRWTVQVLAAGNHEQDEDLA